jgi:hypothetical protein
MAGANGAKLMAVHYNGYHGGTGMFKITGCQGMIRSDVFRPDTNGLGDASAMAWDQNSAFLRPQITSLTPQIVINWTPKQVAEFLVTIPKVASHGDGLDALEAKVVEEEIDGEALLLMTQSDFVKMLGLKLGPAIKVFNALLLIKQAKK